MRFPLDPLVMPQRWKDKEAPRTEFLSALPVFPLSPRAPLSLCFSPHDRTLAELRIAIADVPRLPRQIAARRTCASTSSTPSPKDASRGDLSSSPSPRYCSYADLPSTSISSPPLPLLPLRPLQSLRGEHAKLVPPFPLSPVL